MPNDKSPHARGTVGGPGFDSGDCGREIRAFLGCLAGGQEGWWASTARGDINRTPKWFQSIEDLAARAIGGKVPAQDYFVPYPFAVKSKEYENVAELVDVVRADIDPPKNDPLDEQLAFVARQIEVVRSLLGEPTAIVDSGRGAWVYLKLDRLVTKDEARSLNRLLHLLSGTDDISSYNPSQWARLPGSVNEKNGRVAKVEALHPDTTFDPDALRKLLKEHVPIGISDKAPAASKSGYEFPFPEEHLAKAKLRRRPVLSKDLWAYVKGDYSKEETLKEFGKTRSDVEQKIFVALVGQKWSDEEIHVFAYQHEFPRYMREFRRENNWAELSIANARVYVSENPLVRGEEADGVVPSSSMMSTTRQTAPPLPETGEKAFGKSYWANVLPGRKRNPRLPWEVLKAVTGDRPGVLYREFEGLPGGSKRNLQTIVSRLEEKGWVDRFEGEDGVDRLVRTRLGDQLVGQKRVPYKLVSGAFLATPERIKERDRKVKQRQKREATKKAEERRERAAAKKERDRKTRERDDRKPTPVSRKSLENKRARNIYRTDADGRLRLHFDGTPKVYYLQLVTPMADIVTVRFHSQLHVGWEHDGMPRYANAISPTDPRVVGHSVDPAIRRGRQPWKVTIAVGAFLTKRGADFVVAETVSAEGEIVPAVGLVVQDVKDFWRPLITTLPDPNGRVLRVKKSGPWNDRNFEFEDAGKGIMIPNEICPNLDSYLEEIGSAERLKRLVDSVPEHYSLKHHLR